jgi:hypothetical protein
MSATQAVSHPVSTSQSPQNGTILYGGSVRLDFEQKGHSYTVTDERGSRHVPSVTQILGVIDKSGPLTQWAANMTSEYIRSAIRPGLRYDEIQLGEIIEQARFNFRTVSRGAKTVGQLAHEWIEAYLRARLQGTPELPLPINEQASKACRAAAAWIDQHFKPMAMEHRLYSREYDFAGTLDVFGSVDGQLAIPDWKAAGAIYREFRLQTAAYAQAWAEMHDERVPDRWVIRLDKDTGEFEAVKFPRESYRADLRGFLAAKTLHLTLEGLKTGSAPRMNHIGAPSMNAQVRNGDKPNPAVPRPMAPVPAQMPRAVPPAIPPAPAPRRAPRRMVQRASGKQIFYQRYADSLIISGDVYKIIGTLKKVLLARGSKVSLEGETPARYEWTMAVDKWESLVGLCQKCGIQLIPAGNGRAA